MEALAIGRPVCNGHFSREPELRWSLDLEDREQARMPFKTSGERLSYSIVSDIIIVHSRRGVFGVG